MTTGSAHDTTISANQAGHSGSYNKPLSINYKVHLNLIAVKHYDNNYSYLKAKEIIWTKEEVQPQRIQLEHVQ